MTAHRLSGLLSTQRHIDKGAYPLLLCFKTQVLGLCLYLTTHRGSFEATSSLVRNECALNVKLLTYYYLQETLTTRLTC